MRTCSAALGAFIALSASSASAFTPTSFLSAQNRFTLVPSPSTSSSGTVDAWYGRLYESSFRLEMASESGDKSDPEEEDFRDDEISRKDEIAKTPRNVHGMSPIDLGGGLKYDPRDGTAIIKPRPGKYGFKNHIPEIPDEDLVQGMTQDQRKQNLEVVRQIYNQDLPKLWEIHDDAGWLEAKNELIRRTSRDPWFSLNDRLTDAIQLNEEENIEHLTQLIAKLGGPPPGVTIGRRGYALKSEIYDLPVRPERLENVATRIVRDHRHKLSRANKIKMKQNEERIQREWEEHMKNPFIKIDREIKERRAITLKRTKRESAKRHKRRLDFAKKITGKYPEAPQDRDTYLQSLMEESKDELAAYHMAARMGRIPAGGFTKPEELTKEKEEYVKAKKEKLKIAASGDKQSSAQQARRASAVSAGGRPRLEGDKDVAWGELEIPVDGSSTTTTGPLTVEVSSSYNAQQSDPLMRKHCFQYTIRITNNSPTDTVQLLSRRFEIQTVGSSMKDVVEGKGVTGRQPIVRPGEVFEYTSTAPLSVRPVATTIIAARMKGEYRYVVLEKGQETATKEQAEAKDVPAAELGMFHFIFPEEQRARPYTPEELKAMVDDDEDDGPSSATTPAAAPQKASPAKPVTPASSLPGDSDMTSGDIAKPYSDASDTVTEQVKVQVSSSYRPERSDDRLDKHCFAYNVRITNERANENIQLVSRRFEIQTVGSAQKDVVQGPGVTGRQPVLKPGESFEYTSTAPLSVKPMTGKTPVVARMQGEYNFVILGNDGTTPVSSNPLQAKLGMFHFILPIDA